MLKRFCHFKTKILFASGFNKDAMTAESKNPDSSSWMLLLESIKVAVKAKQIEKREIEELLATYESNDEDWMKYVFFDDKHYTCNLIDGDETYNLMLLAWNPSQGTCIHGHPNATSFVKVLSGSLRDIRYKTPQKGQEFAMTGDSVMEKNEVRCIEDSMGLHEMKNDSPNEAISLHLYVPPLEVCQKYDRETAEATLRPVRFNSFYGEKCDHKTGEKCEHIKERKDFHFGFGDMSISVIGRVSKRRHENLFEWRVPDFSLPSNLVNYHSPAFSYSGCSWYLELRCIFTKTYLYLNSKKKKDTNTNVKNMTVKFGIRKFDGSLVVKKNPNRTSRGYKTRFPQAFFLSENYRKPTRNELIITCHIGDVPLVKEAAQLVKEAAQLVKEAAQPPIKFENLETLSSNLKNLLENKANHDVTIKAKDIEFQAHRAILVARSPVFAAMFEHGLSEKHTGVVDVEDSDPESFGDFLQYLYTGRIEDISFRNAYHLYVTSDKYEVNELKSYCVEYMGNNLTKNNVCEVITMADQYEDTALTMSAQAFFNKNVRDILLTEEWETLLKKNHRLANRFLKEMIFYHEIKK